MQGAVANSVADDSVSVQRAILAVAAGAPVVVTDDDAPHETYLVLAAELADADDIAFMVRHSSGFLCVPMPEEDCRRLYLPPMYDGETGEPYTVTVDARDGVTTGISARDRARTIGVLADPESTAEQLCRPGHVVPLRVGPNGVLERRTHPEAAVDLCRLAGVRPVGVIAALSDDAPGAERISVEHGLRTVSIAAIVAYRQRFAKRVERTSMSRVATRHGRFDATTYRFVGSGEEHLALVHGDLRGGTDITVRIHWECVAGDVFASPQCGCADHLDDAIRAVTSEGRGIVLYLRDGSHCAAQRPALGEPVAVDTDWLARSGNYLAASVLCDLGVLSLLVHPVEARQSADHREVRD